MIYRGTYYDNLSDYWSRMAVHRPDWSYDFISIHERDDGYSLMSPLCLVRLDTDCRRPHFENKTFPSFDVAHNYAMRLVRKVTWFDIHVVSCVESKVMA